MALTVSDMPVPADPFGNRPSKSDRHEGPPSKSAQFSDVLLQPENGPPTAEDAALRSPRMPSKHGESARAGTWLASSLEVPVKQELTVGGKLSKDEGASEAKLELIAVPKAAKSNDVQTARVEGAVSREQVSADVTPAGVSSSKHEVSPPGAELRPMMESAEAPPRAVQSDQLTAESAVKPVASEGSVEKSEKPDVRAAPSTGPIGSVRFVSDSSSNPVLSQRASANGTEASKADRPAVIVATPGRDVGLPHAEVNDGRGFVAQTPAQSSTRVLSAEHSDERGPINREHVASSRTVEPQRDRPISERATPIRSADAAFEDDSQVRRPNEQTSPLRTVEPHRNLRPLEQALPIRSTDAPIETGSQVQRVDDASQKMLPSEPQSIRMANSLSGPDTASLETVLRTTSDGPRADLHRSDASQSEAAVVEEILPDIAVTAPDENVEAAGPALSRAYELQDLTTTPEQDTPDFAVAAPVATNILVQRTVEAQPLERAGLTTPVASVVQTAATMAATATNTITVSADGDVAARPTTPATASPQYQIAPNNAATTSDQPVAQPIIATAQTTTMPQAQAIATPTADMGINAAVTAIAEKQSEKADFDRLVTADLDMAAATTRTERGAEIRSTAPLPPMQMVAGSEVANQIKQAALASKGNGTVELYLDPVELGKLDIEFTMVDDRMNIIVRADRDESLDLMRRNADELQRLLKDADVDLGTLTFSQDQSREREQATDFADPLGREGGAEYADRVTPHTLTTPDSTRLDIRI